jgi:uncharacterized membrane protein YbhN (UPF0104 family)
MASPRSSRNLFLLALLVLAGLALLLARHRIHLDARALASQLRAASWRWILLGIALIYATYWLRALRWAVLLRPVQPASAWSLLPWQIIGFTLTGLFGRLTDMARPFLIARHTRTPIATQLAIYSIERAFDLGAAAVLFSLSLALAPRSMPHHEAFARAGLLASAATAVLALLAVTLRLQGDWLARATARFLTPLSPSIASAVSARLLDFASGLRAISTLAEFLNATWLSLLMWSLIAASYLCCTRAFPACPPLATLSIAGVMLLMATSMGGSLLQLPVLGWFTQAAVLAAALHEFFAVPLEPASACGIVVQLVGTLSVIPLGLLVARATGTGLRAAAANVPAASSQLESKAQ